MSFKLIEITYKGVKLNVGGHFTKGSPATREYPGDADEFEIDGIFTNESIHELLEDSIEEIEQQVINEL